METIADIIQDKMNFTIWCGSCGANTWCKPHEIPQALPRSVPIHLAGAYFRCSRCKSKKVICGRRIASYWEYVR